MATDSLTKATKAKKGLKIQPHFSHETDDPTTLVEWEIRNSIISNPDGSTVFKAENIRIPKGWSQVATDIIAQKYFRRAGVPKALVRVYESDVPVWLQRSIPDQSLLSKLPEDQRTTGENDAAQVFHR